MALLSGYLPGMNDEGSGLLSQRKLWPFLFLLVGESSAVGFLVTLHPFV